MGREREGAGVGKVYQISSISPCLGWGTVHGEGDTPRTAAGSFSPALRSPAVGAPHHSQTSFPALANWCASAWMVGFPSLSKNKQSQVQPALSPGQGGRVCVCVEEGKKVDQ